MNILDINIIYCDKDKKYLSDIVSQAKKFKIKNSLQKWKINIITHDNCGENNIGQFQRRLEIIRNTPEDHFIWFVDADDEIINNINLKKFDYDYVDMICFGFKMKGRDHNNKFFEFISHVPQNVLTNNEYFYKMNIVGCKTLGDLCGGSLWNKWVKASCWKGVYDYLCDLNYENIRPIGSEDCFLSFYAQKNLKNVLYLKEPIYSYHNERSSVFNDGYITYENFKRFRTNHKEITQAIKNLGGPSIEQFLVADFNCHINKAMLCFDIKKAVKDIVDEIGKETFIKYLIIERFNERHPYVKYLIYKYVSSLS